MQNHSKSLRQLPHTSLYSTTFSITLGKHLNTGFRSLRKQLKFIGFQSFRNNPNIDFHSSRTPLQFHWSLNTLKTNSILTFAHCEGNSNSLVFENSKAIPTLAFVYCESNLNSLVSETSKTIPILAFVHCKSNSNSLVSKTSETIPTLAFVYCESNSNSLVLYTSEMIPTLAFVYCESKSNSLVSETSETIPTLAFTYCKSDLMFINSKI